MAMLLALDSDATSDELLAVRAAAGASGAFASLVARHQRRMYRLALRMCRNGADAEDVVQETFALAHRGIRSFRGEAKFLTWLYRIALNEVLAHRRWERRRPVESLDTPAELAGDLAPVSITGGAGVNAEDLLDQKMLHARVVDALGALDESHRAALVLRDLEELSAQDAGRILGVSPEVVRQRAHRARAKIREQLSSLGRPTQ